MTYHINEKKPTNENKNSIKFWPRADYSSSVE